MPPTFRLWASSSNRELKELIVRNWLRIRELLAAGEILIEINDIRESAG
jgi:hypothetical protein